MLNFKSGSWMSFGEAFCGRPFTRIRPEQKKEVVEMSNFYELAHFQCGARFQIINLYEKHITLNQVYKLGWSASNLKISLHLQFSFCVFIVFTAFQSKESQPRVSSSHFKLVTDCTFYYRIKWCPDIRHRTHRDLEANCAGFFQCRTQSERVRYL